MLKWLVNISGLFLILFTIFWFWASKLSKKTTVEDDIDIIVDNSIYKPSAIKIPKGKVVKLRFLRKDPSPCAEWVIFPKLNIAQKLPLNKPLTLKISIDDPGEYEFSCQMNMYRGKLIVGSSAKAEAAS